MSTISEPMKKYSKYCRHSVTHGGGRLGSREVGLYRSKLFRNRWYLIERLRGYKKRLLKWKWVRDTRHRTKDWLEVLHPHHPLTVTPTSRSWPHVH